MENFVVWHEPSTILLSLVPFIVGIIGIATFVLVYRSSVKRRSLSEAIRSLENDAVIADSVDTGPTNIVGDKASDLDTDGSVDVTDGAEDVAAADNDNNDVVIEITTESNKYSIADTKSLFRAVLGGLIAVALSILFIGIPLHIVSYVQKVSSLTEYLGDNYSISVNGYDAAQLIQNVGTSDLVVINYQTQLVPVSLQKLAGSDGGYILLGNTNNIPIRQ